MGPNESDGTAVWDWPVGLVDDREGSAALDEVASGLALDHDASLRGVAAASSAMDKEPRAATHVVRGGRVQVVAIRHSLMREKLAVKMMTVVIAYLEGVHVAESVGSLWKWTNTDLALARRVVSAGAGLATAASGGVDV